MGGTRSGATRLVGVAVGIGLAIAAALPAAPSGAAAAATGAGKPPAGTLGGALSAISHDYAVGCRDQALQVRVQTIFMPKQSWVTYRIASSGLASRVGLAHEQIHFDLGEVYARRIRKLFRELHDPCPRSDAELMGMAEQVIKEHWTVQRRYDFETENGQIERRQNDWARKIAGELAALSEFVSRSTAAHAEVPSVALKCRRALELGSSECGRNFAVRDDGTSAFLMNGPSELLISVLRRS